MRLAVYPGNGVVARLDHVVLLVLGGDGAMAAASGLVEACRSIKGLRTRLREIGQGGSAGVAFLAVAEQGESIDIFVHGVMKVDVTLEGSHMEFASGEPGGWLEESLRGKPVSIAAGEKAAVMGSPQLLDLERGVVPGAGFEMVARAAAPAAEVETPPADDTVLKYRSAISEEEGGLVPEVPPTVPPAPAASVTPSGEAVPRTAVAASPFKSGAEEAAPLPVGRLSSKDGTVVVDRGLVIGRQPAEAPEVANGMLIPFQVPASEAGVSRVHAEVRIDANHVLVVDRDSANGTFVKPPGANDWIRLEPGHAVQIVHGTGVAVGPYELIFEPV